MNKKTVSLCMIVKDEEVYLRRCLESVSNQVDEIIIVDTGSKDSTLNIAKEFKAKIFNFVWEDDFAAARNFSIENANSEYILVLDADEYLDNDADIQEVLKEKKDFYIINFKNYMDGGYISNHQAIRLFKNKIGLKYFGKIHEHLNIDNFKNLTMKFVDFHIHHDGYRQELYKAKNKYDRNLHLLKQEVRSNPTGYNLFNLGSQYKASENYIDALKAFKQSFALSKDQFYLPYLLYLMGDCLLQLKRYSEGMKLLTDSIEVFPKYTGFHYLMGFYYEKLNYLKAAEDSFKKSLELGEVENIQSLEGVGSYLAYIKLSEIQQKQGKLVLALDSSFLALKMKKGFLPALSQYYSVMKSAGIKEADIYSNLKKSYPITDIKDLEVLAKVLYGNRSKLLQNYINEYQLNLDQSVSIVSAIYNNRYSDAQSLLVNEEVIKPEIFSEIISLCLVENNPELYSNLLAKTNLNKRERKTLSTLIEKDNVTKVKLPDSLFDTIKSSLLCLLRMEEETVFNNLYSKIFLTEVQKEQLIKLLINDGYFNVTVDILIGEIEKKSNKNHELVGILADVYAIQNRLNDAYEIYQQLIEQRDDYSSYNRMYNLYEKINYEDGISIMKQKMDSILTAEMAQ